MRDKIIQVSKHGASRAQKPYGLLGTGTRGGGEGGVWRWGEEGDNSKRHYTLYR